MSLWISLSELEYSNVAAATLLCWDQCLSLDEEIDLVWSTIKVLYFLMRYNGLAGRFLDIITQIWINLSVLSCIFTYASLGSGMLSWITFEILLIVRVCAVYGDRKYIRPIIVLLFICEVGIGLYIFLAVGIDVNNTDAPISEPGGPPTLSTVDLCILGSIPDAYIQFWIPGAVFQFGLFVLVTFRSVGLKFGRGPLLHVFIRDGMWAYVLVFAALAWNFYAWQMTWYTAPVARSWLYTATAYAGPRMILNIRAAAVRGNTMNTGDLDVTHGTVVFAERATVDVKTSDTDTSMSNTETED